MSKRTKGEIRVCPNENEHTDCPDGYIQWHNWAEEMQKKGYRQIRCKGCGLLKIWTL